MKYLQLFSIRKTISKINGSYHIYNSALLTSTLLGLVFSSMYILFSEFWKSKKHYGISSLSVPIVVTVESLRSVGVRLLLRTFMLF